jgi:hypothetical protein
VNTEEWCPAVDDKKEALERYRRVHKYVELSVHHRQ